jgi:hypothetical protein
MQFFFEFFSAARGEWNGIHGVGLEVETWSKNKAAARVTWRRLETRP